MDAIWDLLQKGKCVSVSLFCNPGAWNNKIFKNFPSFLVSGQDEASQSQVQAPNQDVAYMSAAQIDNLLQVGHFNFVWNSSSPHFVRSSCVNLFFSSQRSQCPFSVLQTLPVARTQHSGNCTLQRNAFLVWSVKSAHNDICGMFTSLFLHASASVQQRGLRCSRKRLSFSVQRFAFSLFVSNFSVIEPKLTLGNQRLHDTCDVDGAEML